MIRFSSTQLWVHDQAEALDFYTKKLGWEVTSDITIAEMGNFRWLAVAPAGQPDVAVVRMGNDAVGLSLESSVEPVAAAWWSSIDTVSISEDGFERTHQGSCLLFVWPLQLEPGAEATFRVSQRVTTTRDRAEDEGL